MLIVMASNIKINIHHHDGHHDCNDECHGMRRYNKYTGKDQRWETRRCAATFATTNIVSHLRQFLKTKQIRNQKLDKYLMCNNIVYVCEYCDHGAIIKKCNFVDDRQM